MSQYFGFFKMTFKGELQYRAKALSGIATQFFWGLMYVYLYTAFMGGKVIDGFSLSQMATYVWLGQAFFAMRYIGLPRNSANEIENGNVCYKFVRPISIYDQWFSEYLGEKVASTILRCVPILIITFFLPAGVGMTLPVSFGAFLVFLLSLCISFCISVAFSMWAVYLTFLTNQSKSSKTFIFVLVGLFSGMCVPIPLMPIGIQKFLNYLPFRFLSDLPFRIYIGNIGVLEGLVSVLFGAIWLIVLIVVVKLLMKTSLKKVVIQGG